MASQKRLLDELEKPGNLERLCSLELGDCLSESAFRGHDKVVKLLLERSAQEDYHMQKALCLAVENNHETVVRLLLEKGADIGAMSDDGMAPLHCITS